MQSISNRILIVEDEALVALHTQQLVTEAGYEVVGPAFDLDQAKQLADTEVLAGAVLDINLAGEFVWPVAAILTKRNIGFFFLTGFNSRFEMPLFCQSARRVVKPLDRPLFLSALAGLRDASSP